MQTNEYQILAIIMYPIINTYHKVSNNYGNNGYLPGTAHVDFTDDVTMEILTAGHLLWPSGINICRCGWGYLTNFHKSKMTNCNIIELFTRCLTLYHSIWIKCVLCHGCVCSDHNRRVISPCRQMTPSMTSQKQSAIGRFSKILCQRDASEINTTIWTRF